MNKHQDNSKKVERLARKIGFLDKPERIRAFPPEELLRLLPIKKSDNILDMGAGTGYLTIPAAQKVDGSVYALDMDPEMLKVIASKAEAEAIANIKLVEGSIDNLPLPEASVDIALASLVLHEVKPLSGTLQQIKRVLKEGGYFLCFEYEKVEDAIDGPPMAIRIPSSIMEQEIINAGFSIIQKLSPADYMYIFIAKK